ncbi:MAG: pyridoxal-dependent decarboxylase [Pseudomonadota bacterium]
MPIPVSGVKHDSLDPSDWHEARRVAHQVVDDIVDYLETIRERPAWQSVPEHVKQALDQDLPLEGAPLGEVYQEFKENILPYPTGNLHPGFFGWVMGTGTFTGVIADALMATMNAHVAGYDQSAGVVERKVISWLAELVGFPKDSSGLLVTGGTMANLNGLAVARHEKAGFDIRRDGLQGMGSQRLRVYGSVETHSWIYRACELMGLGRDSFRAVPVNEHFQMNLAACRQMIEADIARGDKPFCILGTVGSVNTGAIDDLVAIRNLADRFDLWFHIDGAFGTLAAWAEDARFLVEDQALADSIAFDLHKWGYMPYDVGCVLTKNPEAQNEAFGQSASYLSPTSRGLAVGTTYFADKGIQLSRSFRALKVWMSLKEQGVSRIGRAISKNISQARYLERKARSAPEIELLAPVSLNVVCLRFLDNRLSEAELNELNQEILLRIQESGTAVPSHTVIDESFAIRVCITNHRTENSDLDRLITSIRNFGQQIVGERAA